MSLAAAGTPETPEIRPWRKFEGHTNWVTDVIHLPGEQQIMTSSFDDSLRVWNLQSGKQIGNDWGDEGSRIALSPDGQKVVSGGWDGGLKLWDTNTSKVIAEWTGHTDYVTSVCWSQDGGRVMSGFDDGTARVWDMESGKTVLAIETGLSEVEAVTYSPDMTMIATGGDSEDLKEFIKIWDAKTGKLITNLKGHRERVFCLAWTADGSGTKHEEIDSRTLISGSYDDSIRTWNTTTWQQIHVLTGHTSCVCDIAISPNGPILASASWDDTVQLWNLENGLPIGSPLQHPHPVQCVSFSTDGKLLATGCWDNNAYSWNSSGILEEAGLLNPNVS
jgi:hypothetical protein